MKRSDFKKGLARYLLKRDVHLNLNITQTTQLAHYIDLYTNKIGMLPPNDGKKRYIKKSSVPCVINARNCHQWEAEDE